LLFIIDTTRWALVTLTCLTIPVIPLFGITAATRCGFACKTFFDCPGRRREGFLTESVPFRVENGQGGPTARPRPGAIAEQGIGILIIGLADDILSVAYALEETKKK